MFEFNTQLFDTSSYIGYVPEEMIEEISAMDHLSTSDRYALLNYFKIFSQKAEDERWEDIEKVFHEHEKEFVCISSMWHKGCCYKMDTLNGEIKDVLHPYLKLRQKNKIRHEIKQRKLEALVHSLAEKYMFVMDNFADNAKYEEYVYKRIYKMIIDDLYDQVDGKVVWLNDDEKLPKTDFGYFEFSSPLKGYYLIDDSESKSNGIYKVHLAEEIDREQSEHDKQMIRLYHYCYLDISSNLRQIETQMTENDLKML